MVRRDGAFPWISWRADTAIMMLTHRWSARIAAHFERLRAEAGSVFPVYLVFSLAADESVVPEGCSPDIVVRPKDALQLLPNRVALAEHAGTWTGSADRFSMPAMMALLGGFERIWFIEYDVDFAGDWGTFFRATRRMRGDYVATHLRSRADDPDWPHWNGFTSPPECGPQQHIASFHPIARFSRPFITAYADAIGSGAWDGHTEALYPTIAASRGLSAVDLGGRGPFVVRRGAERHYRAARSPRVLSTDFGYRPPFGFQYFHEEPAAFGRRNWLYHPIKLVDAGGAPDLLMDITRPDDDVPDEIGSRANARSEISVPKKIRREIRRIGRQLAMLVR